MSRLELFPFAAAGVLICSAVAVMLFIMAVVRRNEGFKLYLGRMVASMMLQAVTLVTTVIIAMRSSWSADISWTVGVQVLLLLLLAGSVGLRGAEYQRLLRAADDRGSISA
jgi:hypothetical protein